MKKYQVVIPPQPVKIWEEDTHREIIIIETEDIITNNINIKDSNEQVKIAISS